MQTQDPYFETGTVVQLKSGGPLMTVTYVESTDNIKCAWFDSEDVFHEVESMFRLTAASLVEGDTPLQEYVGVKQGDVVRLKSGGKSMVVSRMDDNNQDIAVCVWFSGDKELMARNIPDEALMLVDANEVDQTLS